MNALIAEGKKIWREIPPAIPGLGLVLAVAIVARLIQRLVPGSLGSVISEILIAVLIGLSIRTSVGLLGRAQPGVTFALHRLLRLGIILLGLRLSLQDVIGTGLSALLLILACLTLALTLAFGTGRVLKIPVRLAVLIGVGTAICGNSAIVATAPAIDAQEDEVGFAVATITLFGLIAVIFYPIIGQALSLSPHVFGLWTGTAVNDTSQVTATAAAYGQGALNIAVVVKLVRNTLMAPIIALIGLLFQRMGEQTRETKFSVGKIVPWFVLGFLGMSLGRTLGVAAGVFPQNIAKPGDLTAAASVLFWVDEASKFLILMALSGIGLGTNIKNLRQIGFKPFIMGLSIAGILAVFSLTVIMLTGM